MAVDYGSLSFAEQIAYFRAKLDLPTERWDDIWGAAHDRAFIVAGAQGADLLEDLRGAVGKAIEEGTTLEEFRRDFERIVAERGWTGWTGEATRAGRAWRTAVIYQTNLLQSYSAGRWSQIEAVRASRPYVQRRHADGVMQPRELHLQWDGLVLRADDPFVQSHPGFDGWGCRCRWFTLSEEDLRQTGRDGPDPAPNVGTYTHTDSRGVQHEVPVGVDPGFGRIPGRGDLAEIERAMRDRAESRYPEPLRSDFLALLDGLASFDPPESP